MTAGFCLEFYLVCYARVRDGDPKSIQSMEKSIKIPKTNLSPTLNFTIDNEYGNYMIMSPP